jgi:hypothetical protein
MLAVIPLQVGGYVRTTASLLTAAAALPDAYRTAESDSSSAPLK